MTNFFADATIDTFIRPKNNPPDRSEEIESWQSRVSRECTTLDRSTQAVTIAWLNGAEIDSYRVECQYRILCQHYLEVLPKTAYKNLMERLGSKVIIDPQIRAWAAKDRSRKEEIVEAIETVIITLIETDNYCRQQIARIGKCTVDRDLRNSLLLATVEEYCQPSIRQLVSRIISDGFSVDLGVL